MNTDSESFIIDAPITKELLEQTAKIARLLARNNSHILLVGEAGGRQFHAVYAAATMQQAKVQMVQGSCNYSLIDFYNDLKLVSSRCNFIGSNRDSPIPNYRQWTYNVCLFVVFLFICPVRYILCPHNVGNANGCFGESMHLFGH